MELFINNKSGAPIYDQIYNQIKHCLLYTSPSPRDS